MWEQALTCPATWKVRSINSPINTTVFATYLKSGGLETKDNYLITTAIHQTTTTAGLALARK